MTTTKLTPTDSILKGYEALNATCKELGFVDVKYLPSPKDRNSNCSDLTKNADAMLNVYKRYINGDNTAPIREIFPEKQ